MENTIEVPQKHPDEEKHLKDVGAYLENTRIMNEIVREMKEIPELPSEKPVDVHPLLRVELPDDGGVLTYMEGYDEPYRGFPFYEFVDKIDTLKKISRGALSSLFHSFKRRPKIQLAFLFLVPWVFNDLLIGGIQSAHRVIVRLLIKSNRYSEPVRELHRVMSVRFHGESERSLEIRLAIRDLTCMLLENDNAYRFRFQDIISELDKVALRKKPAGELDRLLTLMQTREVTQEIKDTWTLLKTFLPAFLMVNRGVRKQIVEVLSSLDLSRVRLSKEDVFFCKPRKDYKFNLGQNDLSLQ